MLTTSIPSDIRSTTYHLYSDRIGTGSSCDVYKGIQKDTAKIHAVKIAKDRTWEREIQKEISTLLRLSRHPNIIEYYGQEQDGLTKLPCLIIEYCSGGSLHSYLKEVENRRGLPDAEFIILLDHITSGVDHLRQHNCIHRDIKPGNILRHMTSEGRSVYKLSDFGASRLLKSSHDEFNSLAGTEEYLHPAMYEKAFVNRKSNAMFNQSADMWSLGCTLYQASSGEMPFVPFDGARKNRFTMYEMVACKPHGSISGSQKTSESAIEWQTRLPEDINMTRSLRKYLVCILVGLLEADPSRQWDFATYKKAVTQITNLRHIVVLYCDEMKLHQFYLSPHNSFAEFQDSVAEETDVPAGNQKLYYHQLRLTSFLKTDSSIAKFPPATSITPILLISQLMEAEVRTNSTMDPYPSFRIASSISEDIDVANNQCDTIYKIHKLMVEARAVISGIYSALVTLRSNLQQKHYRLEKKYQPWFESFRQIRWCFDEIKKVTEDTNGMKSQLEKMLYFQPIAEFYSNLRHMKDEVLQSGCDDLWTEQPPILDNDWCKLTANILERGKQVVLRMQTRKKKIAVEYDVLHQQSDRFEMQELTARCVHLWQTSCVTERQRVTADYYRHKQVYVERMDKMLMSEKQLLRLEESRKRCMAKYIEVLDFLILKQPGNKRHRTQKILTELVHEYSIKQTPSSRSAELLVVQEMQSSSSRLRDSVLALPMPYQVGEALPLRRSQSTPVNTNSNSTYDSAYGTYATGNVSTSSLDTKGNNEEKAADEG